MNAMEKVVYSSTLEDPSWNNTTVIRGDLRDQIEALKERAEGDILVAGSAQLVQGLVAAGLVDELHLMVYPVVLGAGKRLFADSPELPFTLVESRPSSQVTLLTLRRA
jgi:dihydrofolate reductase